MTGERPVGRDEVRTAEVVATLCLATDLAIGLPLEHGLQSTLLAMRLADHLGVDPETKLQTYYGCMLFYAGCTADAEIAAELFEDGALLAHFAPVMFGAPLETIRGITRALAGPTTVAPLRPLEAALRLPKALKGHKSHILAICEVAQMLSEKLGMPPSVLRLFLHQAERWDGKGEPGHLRGPDLPLALRVIHVARDAAFQNLIAGPEQAVHVIRERAGRAFDPAVATCLVEHTEILRAVSQGSVFADTLGCEPTPQLTLRSEAIDRALASMGDFADLVSPFLLGHSTSVARLAADAARLRGFPVADVEAVRRAAFVHDIGRVAVPARIWQKEGPLSMDEWEHVRLHPYHSERILRASPSLASLAPVAGSHHERTDGSGYHRGSTAAQMTPLGRLLAAANYYQTKLEPRPYREAYSPKGAAELLAEEAKAGRLDANSVKAVLKAAGQPSSRVRLPAGLTEREAVVVGMLARGLQTKQIARKLEISVKTADRHVQNAYAKMGVSTRAAAALYAMQQGLTSWGELPMVAPRSRG